LWPPLSTFVSIPKYILITKEMLRNSGYLQRSVALSDGMSIYVDNCTSPHGGSALLIHDVAWKDRGWESINVTLAIRFYGEFCTPKNVLESRKQFNFFLLPTYCFAIYMTHIIIHIGMLSEWIIINLKTGSFHQINRYLKKLEKTMSCDQSPVTYWR